MRTNVHLCYPSERKQREVSRFVEQDRPLLTNMEIIGWSGYDLQVRAVCDIDCIRNLGADKVEADIPSGLQKYFKLEEFRLLGVRDNFGEVFQEALLDDLGRFAREGREGRKLTGSPEVVGNLLLRLEERKLAEDAEEEARKLAQAEEQRKRKAKGVLADSVSRASIMGRMAALLDLYNGLPSFEGLAEAELDSAIEMWLGFDAELQQFLNPQD